MTQKAQSIALDKLLTRLGSWMSVADFIAATDEYFLGVRSPEEIAGYRARRGHLKKLCDEVVPVLHHIRFTGWDGEIRFELGSGVPDCWLRSGPDSDARGLEVTVAQGREQFLLGKELNEKGIGRGFIGLSDNASAAEANLKLGRNRAAYSAEQALKSIGDGIKLCLKKKNDTKYAGLNLLIEAPLRTLLADRWASISDDLQVSARESPFDEIYIIGNHDTRPFGFRIK